MRLGRSEILWAFLVLCGLGALAAHSTRPGRPAEAPAMWPGGLALGRSGSLLLFVHPRCPCSRASLHQLALLNQETTQADPTASPAVTVVFIRPQGCQLDFHQTDLWRQSQAIPGVVTLADDDGRLTRRFGTYTSGQALLYDGHGRLIFEGGLTSARGHEGDSAGMNLLRLALRSRSLQPSTSVFGCPLVNGGDELCKP